MAEATATVAGTVERVFKPIQQFTRGWMMSPDTDRYGVELGMRTPRCVGAQPADALAPCTPGSQRVREMRGVVAVDEEIGRISARCLIGPLYGVRQRFPGGQASVRFHREGDGHRHGGFLCRHRDANGLVDVIQGE